MPGSNNRMTQEQFENEQMESFNRIRSNIQARIVELEGAVEGSNEYDELQQLRNDLNDFIEIEIMFEYVAYGISIISESINDYASFVP